MSYTWIPSSSHQGLPPDAVYAGNDTDGSPIYVGRAFHEGEQIPAKVLPTKQAAYISHTGMEIFKPQFEVLSGHGLTWVASSNGHVPDGAIMAGSSGSGEPLYIGRAHHEGSLTPGKIHKSHGCLYIPFAGSEHSHVHYEVLVGPNRSIWTHCSSQSPLPFGAIHAGHDSDGAQIYVGKAFHDGDMIPAKVIPSKQVAYVAHGGMEIAKHQYEMLCNGNVSWVPSSFGQVPHGAVPGGRTASGETLYVGRAHYQGSLTPGKVQPSHQTLYIAYGGSEVAIKSYEILVEY